MPGTWPVRWLASRTCSILMADQAWKDTNDILFSHQLKYDAELTKFITGIERILQGKCMEIWDHITCITEAAHLSLEAGLCLTLHIVESLPTIPVDLCFHGMIPMLLTYCPEFHSHQTWDPAGDRDYLLDADAWVLGVLLRKLAQIQGSTPMDSHSPCCAPSPAGSTGSIGSGASLPPGGHILCTHSETPTWMRDWSSSSSSSSCSHRSDSDADDHESEGSGGPPGSQSDGEQDSKANKSASDHSDGKESDGNAEEQDNSGQQDNTQEAAESSGNETSSETRSSEVPASKAAKSAIIDSDSVDSESSTDSDSRETTPLVPTPKKEGKEAKSSTAQSSLLLFLDPKLPEEQQKIEQCNHAHSLDTDFSKW